MISLMEKLNKLSLPAVILIASIILGIFIFASQVIKQRSIEKQQQIELQAKTEQEKRDYIAKKKTDCLAIYKTEKLASGIMCKAGITLSRLATDLMSMSVILAKFGIKAQTENYFLIIFKPHMKKQLTITSDRQALTKKSTCRNFIELLRE